MTKREVLTKVVNGEALTEEEAGVVKKMIEGLDKKSNKPSKAQRENVGVKNDILAVLADGRARTAKEVADEVGYSTAKVSALLRAIVLDGKAEKVPGAKSKDAPTYVAVDGAEPYPVPTETTEA